MFSTLFLLSMYACSWVIPDYWMNKVINEPAPAEMMVRMIPTGVTCADKKDSDGKWGKDIQIHVDFRNMPPEVVKLYINNMAPLDLGYARAHTLEFTAGVGRHIVRVEGETKKSTNRAVYVFYCPAGIPAPYMSDSFFFNE